MKTILNTVLLFCILISNLVYANNPKAAQALQKASAEKVTVYLDSDRGAPQFITGRFSYPRGLNKIETAKRFCSDHHEFLQIPASHRLEVIKTFNDGDNTVVRISQYINGIPIFGSDVAINIAADNAVRVVSGKFYNVDFDTTPRIDKDAAIRTAIDGLGDVTLTKDATAELNGYVTDDKHTGLLTWHVVAETQDADGLPGQWHIFVDAHGGELITRFNNIETGLNRLTYDANSTRFLPGTLLISEGGTSTDVIAQTTHDHIGTSYNYFLSAHGRDSYDGAGASIKTTVHYGANFVNAFWSSTQLVFGDGDGLNAGPMGTGLDVVAHEFTHAVTQFTANLIYRNETGALNESMSDVFAVLVDADDYLIGEDVWTPGIPGDALRYMDNPPLGNQPDHMSGYVVTNFDNGGVHINSGIPNKAFFNIASVVGRPAAGQIYYRALTVYITAATGFVGTRLALTQAAEDLFGVGSPQAAAVESGFDAVGILAPADFPGNFVSSPASSPHPYPDNTNYVVTSFTDLKAAGIKVHFTAFNTESGVDFVNIQDGNGNTIYRYSGNLGAFTSGPVATKTIKINLQSNASVSAYGFDIDGYVVDPQIGNMPPVALVNGPYFPRTGIVGTILFSALGSHDPDGTFLSYHWDFGDGTTATGVASLHRYNTAGVHNVTLTVTDAEGAATSATTTATTYASTPPDFAGTFNNDPFSTPHPYLRKTTYTKTYTRPMASAMKVRFTAFDVMGLEKVKIKDSQGRVFYTYTGNLGPFVSGPVPGESITVELITDTFFPRRPYGFDIDGYFFKSDLTPPVISGVSIDTVTTAFTQIHWNTDESADTQIEYGETTAYGNILKFQPGSMGMIHALTLDSLQAGATYNFRVKSADIEGNLAVSGNFSFSVPTATDTVILKKGKYNGGKLIVDADCSDPTATLKLFLTTSKFSMPALYIGTMSGNGKGRYRFKSAVFVLTADSKITVLSSGGGFQTFWAWGQAPQFAAGNTFANTLTTAVPQKYELFQNYPNPFNPTTEIRYSLKETGAVTLKVYNVMGQVVATLVDGVREQGSQEIMFDASHLASGAYFYRLRTTEGVFTRKLLLMK